MLPLNNHPNPHLLKVESRNPGLNAHSSSGQLLVLIGLPNMMPPTIGDQFLRHQLSRTLIIELRMRDRGLSQTIVYHSPL